MTNTHNDNTSAKLRLVNDKRIEGIQYRLYSFETAETSFYVIYIYDGSVSSAETIFATAPEIERLFGTICEGRVCCEHLADIAADYKNALIC